MASWLWFVGKERRKGAVVVVTRERKGDLREEKCKMFYTSAAFSST